MRGGISSEYEVSLKTGASVLSGLPDKYSASDILISKDGKWYLNGVHKSEDRIADNVDVIFNCLHGYYGEDGKVQHVLDSLSVPYTGSDVLASALGMNKALAKNRFKELGIKVPYSMVLREEEYEGSSNFILNLFRKLPQPPVVKPARGGSSIGTRIAYNPQELKEAIEFAFEIDDLILIEQFINGREATCGVIDDYRGKDHYALFPVEIIKPKQSKFFDYEAKYGGQSQELCPAVNLTQEEKNTIEGLAVRAHKAIGARHYSRSDFIVNPRGIYLLEINTLPGLTTESLLPKSLNAVGFKFPEFLDHIIMLALSK